MKCLSLTQPWATLVVIGAKRIETRGWRSHYVGRAAIHAAKTFPRECQELCFREPFARVLQAHFGEMNVVPFLPVGAVIGEVDFTGCVPTKKIKENPLYFHLSPDELAFGDYSDLDAKSGKPRYGLFLSEPKEYAGIFPAKGALGFWEWEGRHA